MNRPPFLGTRRKCRRARGPRALVRRGTGIHADPRRRPQVHRPAGDRLFGFKAHFSGPDNDNVELYFFQNCYVGISAIENGATNVSRSRSGSESSDPSAFTPAISSGAAPPAPREPAPLTRTMDWLITGPLSFPNGLANRPTRLG